MDSKIRYGRNYLVREFVKLHFWFFTRMIQRVELIRRWPNVILFVSSVFDFYSVVKARIDEHKILAHTHTHIKKMFGQ